MAQLTPTELEHLKKLCRLALSTEEEAELLSSLQRVLSYVELLKEVSTENVPTCSTPLRSLLQNTLRADEVKDLLPREEFLAQAAEHIGGMVRVPPVLKSP